VARRASFGLTLSNRGVVLGRFAASALLDLAAQADACDLLHHVWVGDSILNKPRLETIALLGAVAGRTRRVRLGVGCMATFVQRHPVLFALQWASLDVISNGRALLAACLGYPGGMTPSGDKEYEVMGIQAKERPQRFVEMLQALRVLWSDCPATFTGRYYAFDGVDLEPKPIQQPCPIWIASNPTERTIGAAGVERALRRVARFGDGWMTGTTRPPAFHAYWDRIREYASEAGRAPDALESCMYYGFNVNRDPSRASRETKEFLEAYYAPLKFPDEWLPSWAATGTAEQVTAMLRDYVDAGADHITLRPTSWDQAGQFRILVEQILPALGAAAVGRVAASGEPPSAAGRSA
jgi:alkanesulfonate monooxygenase SsuD/methylene tetrahydromethanopterin reductase-like flavin-dependent oxidoreductase (luciferase family)